MVWEQVIAVNIPLVQKRGGSWKADAGLTSSLDSRLSLCYPLTRSRHFILQSLNLVWLQVAGVSCGLMM